MAVGGRVYKAFMMCLLCGRWCLVVFTKRVAGTLWKREAGSATVDAFQSDKPNESGEKARHAVWEAMRRGKFGTRSQKLFGWSFPVPNLEIDSEMAKNCFCKSQMSGVGMCRPKFGTESQILPNLFIGFFFVVGWFRCNGWLKIAVAVVLQSRDPVPGSRKSAISLFQLCFQCRSE